MSGTDARATQPSFRHALLLFAICALLAARPVAAAAVEPRDSTRARPSALQTRLYVGMWSTHILDINRGLGNNSLIGLSYHGFFAATFINSFGDRAVSAGIQRNISPDAAGAVKPVLGYRAGLLTGYDERFFGIGDKLPVIPFMQLLGNVDWRRFGIEVAYAGIVASVVLNMKL